jgi:hypothetical protein
MPAEMDGTRDARFEAVRGVFARSFDQPDGEHEVGASVAT